MAFADLGVQIQTQEPYDDDDDGGCHDIRTEEKADYCA